MVAYLFRKGWHASKGFSTEGPSLLLFSALGLPPFRTVKVRGKRAQCAACGTEKREQGSIEETDYIAFCGGGAPDWEAKGLMPDSTRMTPQV
jgi:adenylyltransferase and sulfurtransferase